MSHGSPPLPKRDILEIVGGVPPPVGAPPGIPPAYDDSGALELLSDAPDLGLAPLPFMSAGHETRARALHAAAVLLGPILASAMGTGRAAPIYRDETDRYLAAAERILFKLATRAEAWITAGREEGES